MKAGAGVDDASQIVRQNLKTRRDEDRARMTGDDIAADASARLAGQKFYPKEGTARRMLFVQVCITEWLALYPKPKKRELQSEWESASRFTEEERKTGLEPIRIKFFKPLFAYAVAHLGKDVENSANPWGQDQQPRWYLMGSSSSQPKPGDLQSVADAVGMAVDEIAKARLEKNANIGAVLLGAVSADDATRNNSPWIYAKAGNHKWAISGVIRWKFDSNGPSALFKNLDAQLNPAGTAYDKQPEGAERLRAVQKKLKKAKYVTVMDPETGRPVEGTGRKTVRAKRRRGGSGKALPALN